MISQKGNAQPIMQTNLRRKVMKEPSATNAGRRDTSLQIAQRSRVKERRRVEKLVSIVYSNY